MARSRLMLCCTLGLALAACVLGQAEVQEAAAAAAAPVPAPRQNASSIPGCREYNEQRTRCITCASPGYKLSGGSCACNGAAGFQRVGRACRATARIDQTGATCSGRCGATNIKKATGGVCHCDYWCNNLNDCCGGSAAKDAACPDMAPTTNKARLSSCDNKVAAVASNGSVTNYRPAMCWCDAACTAAGDCCPSCAQCAAREAPPADAEVAIAAAADAAAAAEDAASPLAAQVAAEVEALAAHAGHDDCGSHHVHQRVMAAAAVSTAAVGAAIPNAYTAEQIMQACQAADQGPPAEPLVIKLFWTAGSVCSGNSCFGGKYSTALVRKQIEVTNTLYAHAGIVFEWDGVIHRANASSVQEIDVGFSEGDWICKQQRHGGPLAMNVMTSPTHVGGVALGVTLYPSYFATKSMPDCANWLYVYEKTLPDMGGKSAIDGGLADSGHVLSHEIGHQLMLAHSWAQSPVGTTAQQCKASASMDPRDIISGMSDGVRDTPAQSLNSTNNPVTNILRFIGCDEQTGAYTNTTANAQQSCNSANGFPAGDRYLNNYNNLMSYGDKSCLRTITPGQAARARCAIKCMWRQEC